MYQSMDHVVRAIFASYGLFGPATTSQIDAGYYDSLNGNCSAEDILKAKREQAIPAIWKGRSLSLHQGGFTFDAAEILSFESLDEVAELAKLMRALVPESLVSSVRIFVKDQVRYNGSRLEPNKDVTITFDDKADLDYEVLHHRTRRGALVIDEIVLGGKFNWVDFARSFGSYACL